MSVFVVLTTAENQALESRLSSLFTKEDIMKMASNQWVVASSDTTARLLSERIGTMNHVVFSIGSYYGRHPAELWEWLKVKMEKI